MALPSFETLGTTDPTTQRHISEEFSLQQHGCVTSCLTKMSAHLSFAVYLTVSSIAQTTCVEW